MNGWSDSSSRDRQTTSNYVVYETKYTTSTKPQCSQSGKTRDENGSSERKEQENKKKKVNRLSTEHELNSGRLVIDNRQPKEG